MQKLVFDLDGTLVDSMGQWAGKIINILEENNIKYPDDILNILTPLGEKAVAEYLVGLGLNIKSERVVKIMRDFSIDEYTNRIPAKEGVIETLIKLKGEGYSLNVLTASSHNLLDVCLKRLGIYQMCDNVWSCDDFGTSKSDINIYYEVAKRLNTTVDNCVFFDDNPLAVETAKKAGMKVVGVYDQSSAEYEQRIRKICDKYVYKLSEIF